MTQQERLNRLGEQWSADKDDPDKRKRLEDEIFTLALSIFGKFRVKNTGVSLMEGIGLKPSTSLGGTSMRLCVDGLMMMRSIRFLTSKVPNPGIMKGSPD